MMMKYRVSCDCKDTERTDDGRYYGTLDLLDGI